VDFTGRNLKVDAIEDLGAVFELRVEVCDY